MHSRAWFTTAFSAALLMAAPLARLAAQGWIEPLRPGAGLVRLRTAVTARVSGRVARVEVEEWFENRGGGLAEGDYYYPLPGEGAFADLSLFLGDKELKGETMDAQQARSIYEEIVRRRRDPALVELVGHGLLRARVFPIAPGEKRRVVLRYTQLLPRAGDALVFRYAVAFPGHGSVPPWPVQPRPWRGGPVPRDWFHPLQGGDSAPAPGPGAAPRDGTAPIDFRLIVQDAGAFRDPFSPTHELRSERTNGQLVVRPAGELRGDLAVFLPLREAGRAAGVSVVAYRTGEEDGYALISLYPGEIRGQQVPRDLALVLDVSGSMSGDKLDQAKRALRQLLSSMSPSDRFRLIAFSSDVDPYRSAWTPATPAELAAALRWVDGLQANGSTNIAGALTEAFRGTAQATSSRLPIVVFLTDGMPTVGEQNPERIAEQAEKERGAARVFAFGVGFDVNTRLLDRLTEAARGTTSYVEPGEDLERPLAELAARIRHPVLTDLRLAGAPAPVELRDVYPNPLPDLFSGDELVLLARYRGSASGQIAFEGRAQDRTERVAANAAFPAQARTDDYIPRLWASRKIGVLTRELRLHGHNAEVEKEIKDLGLRYGILTDFTAYLVQEPGMVAQAAAAPAAAFQLSGNVAVKSAELARRRRDATTVAAMNELDAVAYTGMGAAGGRADASGDGRVVGGRRFTLKDGVWTDATRRDGLRTVSVEPFSPAYFALLRALPELSAWWSAFEKVDVGGARVALKVAPGGARELTAADIARLVREFRQS